MPNENLNDAQTLPPNTVGDMLSGLRANILNQAIQHATSTINRIDQMENEMFSLPLRVQNLNWKQFCDVQDSFKLAGSNFSIELHEEQVLIHENISYDDNTRLIISHPDHLIPNIDSRESVNIYTKSSKGINNKGFIMEQRKNNMGILSYISFLPGKKIFGLFLRAQNINQFYYVGNCKTNTIIPNITIDQNIIPRSMTSVLTETDKVIISNASPRFRNQISNWRYLSDALRYFNDLIFQTIDPAYISKLMILNKTLSFASPE